MNHNFNRPRNPWERLTAAARTVGEDREETAPYGFATRMAAMALSQERKIVSLFECFALRAVAIAGLLALGSVALNYSALTSNPAPAAPIASVDEVLLPKGDALAIVLDIAD